MIKIDVKNLKGEKTEELELREDVFGLEMKEELVHQVYVAQYANRRQSNSHTKTRGERAGSTRKPWKQKGTGRARVGSVRTPVWRKGGVVFGPSNEKNYSQKINRKVLRNALKMVLSAKVRDNELLVLDSFVLEEKKTKVMANVLKNLGIDKKVIIAFDRNEKDFALFSRNLDRVENFELDNINVFDLLNNKYFLVSKEGIDFLVGKYAEDDRREVANKKED